MAEKIVSLRIQLKGDKASMQVVDALSGGLESGVKLLKEIKTESVSLDAATKRVRALTDQFTELNKQLKIASEGLKRAAGTSGTTRTPSGGGTSPAQLRREAQELDKQSAAYKELIKLLGQYREKQTQVTTDIRNQAKAFEATKFAAGSYKQLNFELAKLNNTYRNLSEVERRGTVGKETLSNINQLQTRLKSIDADMGIFTRNVGNYQSALSGLQSITRQFFSAIGIAAGATEIIRQNAAISDSIADVAKTAGTTIPEVRALANELKFRDTRTSLADQLKIAEIGGRLGIVRDQLASFTGAVDVLNIALGDQFGDVENLTDSLGGLREQLITFKTDDVASDILRIGNAINILEAQGIATGSGIVNISNRISGLLQGLGVGADEVIGIAATLSNLKINEELGATAIQKVLSELARAPEIFAKFTGKDIEEFKRTVNTDLVGAFTLVLDTLNDGELEATEFIKTLDALGIEGDRAIGVFTSLAGNTELLTKSILTSREALKSTESVYEEFNKKNQTLGASIEKVKNALVNLTVDTQFQDFLSTTLNGVAMIINMFAKLPQLIKENKAEILALAGAILVLNRGVVASSIAAIQASAAYQLMTSATARAELATKLFSAAQKAMPLLLVVAGIYAVVKAFQAYTTNTSAGAKASRALADAQKDIADETAREVSQLNRSFETLKSDTKTKEEKKEVIDELLAQYPKYLNGLDLEKASVEDLTRIQNGLNEEIVKSIAARQRSIAVESELAKEVQARLKLQQIEAKGFAGVTGEDASRAGFGLFGTDFEKRFISEGAQAQVVERAKQLIQQDIDNARATAQAIGAEFDKAFSLTGNQTGRKDRGLGASGKTKTTPSGLTADEIKEQEELEKERQRRAKELRDQEERDIKAAAENISRLQLEAIEKTFEGQKELERRKTTNAIDALIGKPEQVEEQTRLLLAQLDRTIADIDKKQAEAREKALADIEKFNEEIRKSQALFTSQGAQFEVEGINRFYEAQLQQLRLTKAKQLAELESALEKGQLTIELFEEKRQQTELDFTKKRLELTDEENMLLLAAETAANTAKIEKLKTDFEIELKELERQAEEKRKIRDEQLAAGIPESDVLSEADIQAQLNLDKQAAERAHREEMDKINAEFVQKGIDREIKSIEDLNAYKEEARQKEEERLNDIADVYKGSFNEIGLAVGELLAQQEIDQKEFLRNTLNTALRALERIIQLKVAEATADSFAKFGIIGGAIRSAALAALISAGFAGVRAAVGSFEEGGVLPSVSSMSEGELSGASHSQGGIRIKTPSGMAELEGGEHLLKNSREAYVINKRSSRKFPRELKALHGNTNRYDPMKRVIAEQINTFKGFGRAFAPLRKYQSGGALAISPLPAPVIPSGQDELRGDIIALSNELKNMIEAVNGRIDRLTVINNAAETLKEANRRLEVKKARSL